METIKGQDNDPEAIHEHIRVLRNLLKDYSDEIPDELKSGPGNYKVSASWFDGVLNRIDEIEVSIGIWDRSIFEEMEVFADRLNKRRVEGKPDPGEYFIRATKEEIDTANDLLRRLIRELEGRV